MKFTNGFWVVKPEFSPEFVREIYDYEIRGEALKLYAPYRRIETRGDTLNVGLMTFTVTVPMDDVLRVRLENHAGNNRLRPTFPLQIKGGQADIHMGEKEAVISSGSLSMRVTRGRPELRFFAGDTLLTYCAGKSTAMMHRRDGRDFLVTGLGLDVGELVYGLGERFTPLVKNGQSVDIWNEDGGTSSEISYKNIPFYLTSGGYGVFINHTGRVSLEIASEKVEQVQFSVEDQSLEYFLIYGPSPKEILQKYTVLTGRAPVPPKWSFGLWLTTSFTTDYNEETVGRFIDGMAQRDIPLHVFHFDCFWMKGFEWCNFQWDREMFPDPTGMLARLHERGLKVCVWINPYIAQRSPLFEEGKKKGYLLLRDDGWVWQWDMWQAGMALIDFTNSEAWTWYQEKLKSLLDMGVDCFKTDFGERIPTNVRYHNHADPQMMHNYYTHLYNSCVFELLTRERGEEEAVLFARSATAGGQKFPVHWGGDSTSQFVSMAESLRGGLSLMDSGFAFWSHDIGGFEDDGSAALYKRWVAFGMLSSHSRLHGSSSYRVPWHYDEEACEVLRFFTKLKCRLMPYLYTAAVLAHETGVPVMRPMHLEFPEDPSCAYLDRQYMLGDSLLVSPVFREDGVCTFYLPHGVWTHLLTGEVVTGGGWHTGRYDFFSLPLFVRENTLLPMGWCDDSPDYNYSEGIEYRGYRLQTEAKCEILGRDASSIAGLAVQQKNGSLHFAVQGGKSSVFLLGVARPESVQGCSIEVLPEGVRLLPKEDAFSMTPFMGWENGF